MSDTRDVQNRQDGWEEGKNVLRTIGVVAKFVDMEAVLAFLQAG